MENRDISTCFLVFLCIFPIISDSDGILFASVPSINYDTKTFTACRQSLTECPVSDYAKGKRETCYFGYTKERCPQGTHYGCGLDERNGFRVEGCLELNICPRGSSNRVRFDTDKQTIKLECVECDKDRYQDHPANSSVESLTGCSATRNSSTIINQIDVLLLIDKGGPTEPEKFACNVNKGYSDTNRQMYCFVYKPCHCTKELVCNTTTPDLIPDGTCDAKCAVIRNAVENFTCSKYVHPQTSNETFLNTTSTNNHQNEDSTSWLSFGVPAGIVIVLLFIVGALSIYFCKCKNNEGNRSRRWNRKRDSKAGVVNSGIHPNQAGDIEMQKLNPRVDENMRPGNNSNTDGQITTQVIEEKTAYGDMYNIKAENVTIIQPEQTNTNLTQDENGITRPVGPDRETQDDNPNDIHPSQPETTIIAVEEVGEPKDRQFDNSGVFDQTSVKHALNNEHGIEIDGTSEPLIIDNLKDNNSDDADQTAAKSYVNECEEIVETNRDMETVAKDRKDSREQLMENLKFDNDDTDDQSTNTTLVFSTYEMDTKLTFIDEDSSD